MCTEIFEHVFSTELQSEGSHDFSGSEGSLQERITHLLYHLKYNKGNLLGMLSGESSDLPPEKLAGYYMKLILI